MIEMVEFFVSGCTQCGEAYAGALEVSDRRIGRQEATGICPRCLDKLFGLGEGVESQQKHPGDAPKP